MVKEYFKPKKEDVSMKFTPPNIINEYNKRWEKVNKVSFESFYTAARYDSFFNEANVEYMAESYDKYIAGNVSGRYPKLPLCPEELFNQVVEETNKMINYN